MTPILKHSTIYIKLFLLTAFVTSMSSTGDYDVDCIDEIEVNQGDNNTYN